MLGFESADSWSGVSATSFQHTEGTASAIVTVDGWTAISSVPLSTLGALGPILSLDIQVPAQLQYWGEVLVFFQSPSRGVNDVLVGRSSLIGLPAGQFSTLTFGIDDQLREQLSGSYTDLTISVVINAPSGEYLLDRMWIDVEASADGGTGGASGGMPAPIELSVEIPHVRGQGLEDYALVASDDIVLNDRARVLSAPTEAYINWPRPVVFSANGTVELGVGSHVGTALSNGDIFDRTGIVSVLSVRNLFEGTPMYGTDVRRGISHPTETWTLSVSRPEETLGEISLEPDETLPRAPGRYGAVNVKSGATLFLRTGRYFVDSLTLEPASNLVVNTTEGPVEIYVHDSIIYRGNVIEVGGESRILLVSEGEYAAVDSALALTLVAPRAFVDLKYGDHVGAVFAARIVLHQDATFTHRPFVGWNPATIGLAPGQGIRGTPCSDDSDCRTTPQNLACISGRCDLPAGVIDPIMDTWRADTTCTWGSEECNRCAYDVETQFRNWGVGENGASGRHNVQPQSTGSFYGRPDELIWDTSVHVQSVQRLALDSSTSWLLTTYNQNVDGYHGGFLVFSGIPNAGPRDPLIGVAFSRTNGMGVPATSHPGGFQLLGQYAIIGTDGFEDYKKEISVNGHGHVETIRVPNPTNGIPHHEWGDRLPMDGTAPHSRPWLTGTRIPRQNDGAADASAVAAVKLEDGAVLLYVHRKSPDNDGWFYRGIPNPNASTASDRDRVTEGKWTWYYVGIFDAGAQAWRWVVDHRLNPGALPIQDGKVWDVDAHSANFVTECETGHVFLVVMGERDGYQRVQLFLLHGDGDCANGVGTCDAPWFERLAWMETNAQHCDPKRGAGTYVDPDGNLIHYQTGKYLEHYCEFR